jgi:phosphatidylinositol-3-phosphatase
MIVPVIGDRGHTMRDPARRGAGGSLFRLARLAGAALVAATLLTAGCGGSAAAPGPASPTGVAGSVVASSTTSPTPLATGRSLHALAHVVVIVMENETSNAIIGNPHAPFLNDLADHYSLASEYSALFHPSLPNYIALTSGSNQGITDDRSPPSAGYAVSAVNLADRIEASGRTWKLYGESMPSPGYASDVGLYATRHVPFLYYKDILDDRARRTSHIVPFTRLAGDFSSAVTTPDFAFVTPNLRDDMHDAPVAVGDAWLARVVPAILASPAFTTTRSLLVITWDEGVGADQHVTTILAGSGARIHYRSSRPYDHYSLLHTIEADWGLRPLTGNDARAATMGEFLR